MSSGDENQKLTYLFYRVKNDKLLTTKYYFGDDKEKRFEITEERHLVLHSDDSFAIYKRQTNA